jgi:hypothetical protein
VKKIPDQARKIAGAFCLSTGMEYDDLLQEAALGYWLAENDPHYDPHKSAINTYTTIAMVRGLCTVTATHRRKCPATEPLDETTSLLESAEPSAEDVVYIKELIKQLPDDARLIANIVVEHAALFTGRTKNAARQLIRSMLPWNEARTNRAFQQIKTALASET